jgi:hypothetical protein
VKTRTWILAFVTGFFGSISCAQIAGITGDYTLADGGLSDGGSGDSQSPTDGHAPTNDGADARDGASDQDATDAQHDGRVGDSSSCPPSETPCGTSCVDLATDLANCGQCSRACTTAAPSTATCIAGLCIVSLLEDGGDAVTIALGTDSVYAATGELYDVVSVPKTGGAVSTLVTTPTQLPFAIATDGTDVYWGSFGGDGGVYKCPVAGCPTPTTIVSSVLLDVNLAVGGGSVYWVSKASELDSCSTSGACATPKARGGSSAFSRGIVTDGADVYWASPGPSPSPVGIFSQPIGSPAATPTSLTTSPAENLALDTSGNLYWLTSSGAVMTCPVSACGAPRSLLTATYTPIGIYPIATDGTSLYWSDEAKVYKCSVKGCTAPTEIPIPRVEDLAVDDAALYLAAGFDGLYEVTPK